MLSGNQPTGLHLRHIFALLVKEVNVCEQSIDVHQKSKIADLVRDSINEAGEVNQPLLYGSNDLRLGVTRRRHASPSNSTRAHPNLRSPGRLLPLRHILQKSTRIKGQCFVPKTSDKNWLLCDDVVGLRVPVVLAPIGWRDWGLVQGPAALVCVDLSEQSLEYRYGWTCHT